ncbi:MAG: glycosyltransferase family 9 protein, partial [Deltaproteobacteria bacterium]
RELSSIFLTEKLPAYDPDTHAVDRYLKLAAFAGGAQGKAIFRLNITKEDKEKVLGILSQRGIDPQAGARFFVIAPQARWETKLWNDGSFARLAKAAIERFGIYAALAGGEKDKKRLDAICREAGPKAINLAGLIDLKGLAALMGISLFAITVDTGPMHIAAAAGAKVIALFGPTAPWRTGPYGKGHIVIRTGIACSPCFKKKCPDPKCMSEIKVEDALNAIERSLNAQAR